MVTPPTDSHHTLLLDSTVLPKFSHRVRFTRGAFDAANPALRNLFAADEAIATRRAVVLIDDGVARAYGDALETKLRAAARR